jgi:hypothetical protein
MLVYSCPYENINDHQTQVSQIVLEELHFFVWGGGERERERERETMIIAYVFIGCRTKKNKEN